MEKLPHATDLPHVTVDVPNSVPAKSSAANPDHLPKQLATYQQAMLDLLSDIGE